VSLCAEMRGVHLTRDVGVDVGVGFDARKRARAKDRERERERERETERERESASARDRCSDTGKASDKEDGCIGGGNKEGHRS